MRRVSSGVIQPCARLLPSNLEEEKHNKPDANFEHSIAFCSSIDIMTRNEMHVVVFLLYCYVMNIVSKFINFMVVRKGDGGNVSESLTRYTHLLIAQTFLSMLFSYTAAINCVLCIKFRRSNYECR